MLDALTIELDSVEQPSLLLVFVVQLARLGEVLPHRSHRVREPRHRVIARVVLEVAHHLLAVFHGFARLERLVEKRRQLVFLLAGGDRGDDLVKVEVGEIGRRFGHLRLRIILQRRIEDAEEGHGRKSPAAEGVRSATRAASRLSRRPRDPSLTWLGEPATRDVLARGAYNDTQSLAGTMRTPPIRHETLGGVISPLAPKGELHRLPGTTRFDQKLRPTSISRDLWAEAKCPSTKN